ncbi:anion permease [bacterium]|nr:anion permease [bacterium]MBP5434443.1 anion permease [bacterium]
MILAQILSVTIFIVMFALMVTEKIERHFVTLGSAVLIALFVFGLGLHSSDAIIETLNLKTIMTKSFWYSAGDVPENSTGINWATIFFIAGMMVMVEGMGSSGFFRWLCMKLARLVNYRVIYIFVAFMLISFALSMFIDSITVILFLAAVTVELSQLLKFNPVSMILAEIFCANLGGSATMCGDPPNIIIGTSLGYSFGDFFRNTGIIAFICLAFTLVYFFIVCRKEYVNAGKEIDISTIPSPKSAIRSRIGFSNSCIIFSIAVVLLVTHAQTGLTVASIGLGIAALTLLGSPKYAPEILKRVDYKTLLFFIGLFFVVGGLEQTGILKLIADFIGRVSAGNAHIMIAIIIWVSAVASAFIDNIPFAATMIPVIKSLSATTGVSLETMAWALSMGTDIGGSGTPIGASANVVGTSVSAKSGHPVGWGRYCRLSAPAAIIVIAISTLYIFVKYL